MSRHEGVIGKWIVEWYVEVPNSKMGEKVLHYHFQNNHFEKEQFKLTLEKAITESILKLSDLFKITELIVFLKDKSLIFNVIQKRESAIKGLKITLKYLIEEKNENINSIESFKKKVTSNSFEIVEGLKVLLELDKEKEQKLVNGINLLQSEIKVLQSLKIDS